MMYHFLMGELSIELNLPDDCDAESREAHQLFDEASRRIVRRWRELRNVGEGRKGGVANPWLIRVTYDVICRLLPLEPDALFEARSTHLGRYRRGRTGEPNIFQQGLMAIFAHDRHALPANRREELGLTLWHAYRHYVPAAFVVAFWKQVSGKGFRESSRNEWVEPGYEVWIAKQRSHDREPWDRGTYPRVIEDLTQGWRDRR